MDGKGKVLSVAWVDGAPYSGAAITAAMRTASAATLSLTVKGAAGDRTYDLAWRGGLRYPHLEALADGPPVLDAALAPRVPADSRS